ncbi:MAG: ATP-binding cassette subfamily B multidrug efflux pump [Oceanospirillaceae bacterium]|jgi:ATP-binding cassette subfamily B multidrug efflux pump
MFNFFESLITPFPDDTKEQPPNSLLAFFRHYAKGMEKYLILMALMTTGLAIAEVYLFSFMGDLVDWLSTKPDLLSLKERSGHLVRMGLLVLVGMPILMFLHTALVHQTILGNYPMAIRWSMHRYLLKQSMAFYQDDFAGRLATKVMQTSLAIREASTKLLDVFVYIIVYFTSLLFLIAQGDTLYLIPLLLWLAIFITLQTHFIPKLKHISTSQADARADMTGCVVDSYTNIATVKLFSHTQREEDYAQSSMQKFLDTVHLQMRLVTKLDFLVEYNNLILIFNICGMSIFLWLQGSVSAGAIAIAVSLSLRLNGMSQWVMWELSSLFENIGTVIDGMSSLSKPLSVEDEPEAKPLIVSRGKIQFSQVNFNFGKQLPLIENLNITIKAGEKVGLVGRSGAGKSTLINLLMRFYDIQSGCISIDGIDIKSITQESLRSNIGMVTQDTSLLHRSVKDNIIYGRPDASEAQMHQACIQAQAHEFILALNDPDGGSGYHAQVGERGVKLSGGQRQRIAIARVLLKDAPILLLDEATSALDSEVEAAIQQHLALLMQNKTVIAIAHRLSTIAAMDRLIVIDQGKIIEQGSHSELLAHNGVYAQLWAHQSGDFLGE